MKILLFLSLFITSFGYSQDKYDRLFSNAELEFIVPNVVEYDYYYKDKLGVSTDEIANSKPAFGVSYSYNYNVFRKLSLGAITGFQIHGRPDLSMAKLGLTIKYFFVNNDNVHVYLNPFTYNFSLNKNQFNYGANTRIGIGFPVLKREGFNLNLNVFYEVNDLNLEGAKPLYDYEVSQNIIFRSYGASIGIKF